MQTAKGTLVGQRSLRLAYSAWLPDDQPRAVVVLVHGINEHIGRHLYVCEMLVGHGYAVFGSDHRGHGASEGRRASIESFDYFVEDLHLLVRKVREAHPERPIFMLGHSLGGLIAVRYALRYQTHLDGLVLSGPALHVGGDAPPVLKKLGRVIATLVPHLPIVPVAKGENLLSRDPEVERAFRDDPLCYQGKVRARMGYEILKASTDACARLCELRVPLLIMHGADDRVTNPSGSQELYRTASSADKTLKIWPESRHEIFKDLDKEVVLAFLLDWLDRRVAHRFTPAALQSA